jgi:hypothetical protein
MNGNYERGVGGAGGTGYWLLVVVLFVAAAAVTLWNWDLSHRYAIGTLEMLGGDVPVPFGVASPRALPARLTDAQRLLLEGDLSRPTRAEQQRAIWETDPDNRVYLGNYVTALAASSESLPTDALHRELEAARQVEPDNARFDYLEAAHLLNAAAEIKSEKTSEDENGKARMSYSLAVRDREQLDTAMLVLQQGLAKPYWRRYSAEMLAEQLAVLGPARRLVDLVQRTAIAAGTLLPDLSKLRTLARASRLYGELLIAEGRLDEAVPFLEAWNTLAQHITTDSFTLIDLLVATAVANDAAESIPPLYRQMNRPADAERTATTAEVIAKPVNDWREQRKSADQSDGAALLQERGGVLASLLLPALGTWPEAREYEAGRMLEYTVFTEFLVAVVLLALFLVMVVSGIFAWRWRWSCNRQGLSIPGPAVPPTATEIIRVIVIGVVLPLALFFAVTRWLPWSGHNYSIQSAAPRLMAEFGLLVMALTVIPLFICVRQAKRRCEDSGIETTRWHARYLSGAFICLGALLLVLGWLLPAGAGNVGRIAVMAGLGCMAVALIAGVLLGVAQGMVGQARYARYYATAFSALVPMLALTIIVLGVGARSVLLRSEAHWIERDTLMQDRERVGFTRLENDLVHKLRDDMMGRFG